MERKKKKLVYLIKALTDYYNSASIKMITTFSNIKPTQSNYLIIPISEDLTGPNLSSLNKVSNTEEKNEFKSGSG